MVSVALGHFRSADFCLRTSQVAVELAYMFRVMDGKITEHWAVRDDLGMLQKLGAISPPAS
jgi:predicted SnoaL-like aldol condensation-catalyzing enzyme